MAPLPTKYCWSNTPAQWKRLASTVMMFPSESTRLITSSSMPHNPPPRRNTPNRSSFQRVHTGSCTVMASRTKRGVSPRRRTLSSGASFVWVQMSPNAPLSTTFVRKLPRTGQQYRRPPKTVVRARGRQARDVFSTRCEKRSQKPKIPSEQQKTHVYQELRIH